jgi:putative peptidoglycan lipid II flippase
MARAAGVVSAATFLSRILGFFRDALAAAVLGTGPGADAFIVAFRIPNLWRRLVSEGALTVAFIPALLETAARDGRPAAISMAASALRRFGLFLAGFAGLGVLFAPVLVAALAPGLAHRPETLDMAARLARIMLPYLPLVGMAAVCMALLQAEERFAAPSLAPVCLNLAMIGSVLWLAGPMGSPAAALAAGVLLGGGLQLGLQLAALRRIGFSLLVGRSESSGLGRIAVRTVPAALGASVLHVNLVTGTFLASFLPEGRVAALYFADRLVQFPLGLAGAALATAALPRLSRDAAAGRWADFWANGRFALRLAVFITFPAAAGLAVLREPIVELLFSRGAFDAAAVRETAAPLLGFAAGLPAFAGLRVVLAAHFARGDSRVAFRTGLLGMGLNLFLGLLWLKPFGHSGIAWAISAAAWAQLALLLGAPLGAAGRLCDRLFWKSACHSLAGSLLMSPAAVFVLRLFPPAGGAVFRTAGLAAAIAAGVSVYGLFSRFTRHPDYPSLLAVVRKE